MQAIAELTGGTYFRARNPQELASIYLALDELEPVEHETSLYRPRQALGYLPLLGALFLSFALATLRILPGLRMGDSSGRSAPMERA